MNSLLFSLLDSVKNETAATSAPTVNDDASKGFAFGSLWFNTSSGKLYFLANSTEGAANWLSVNGENYKGSWNASTNTPTLINGVGISGDNYKVSVAGSQNLGSGTIVFTIGDLVIYNGTIWEKIEGGVSYVPEDVANKSTDGTMAANSATLYPSQSAVVTYASGKVADSISDGVTTVAPSQNAVFDALALKQSTSAKDATGGYAGLTLFKINFKNAANTFTSFFTNANTAARTYTFQDRDGTILDNTDLSTLNTSIATKQTIAKDTTGGYPGLTLFKINFKNAANTFTSFFTNSNTAARTYTFQDRDGTILDDTNLATINTSLSVKQDANTNLTSLASLTLPVDGLLYSSGAGTITTSTVTAAARTVLDDTTVAAMVNTLGGATSTGSGGLARATSPVFVTPTLGTPASGVLTNCSGYPTAAFPSGTCIKVVSVPKLDTASTTSSTYAAITGMSASITPVNSSSQILVSVVLNVGGTNLKQAHFQLFRGATQIALADAAGLRSRTSAAFYSANAADMTSINFEFLDTPAALGAVTYSVKWASPDNVSAMYINRAVTDTSVAIVPRTISTITLQEFKG